jgi:hypothetical protein
MKRSSILWLIGACILIGFVSQGQLSHKDERTPLYEFRASQAAEEFGLAPSGSYDSELEFGSVATAELNPQIDMVKAKKSQRSLATPLTSRCTKAVTCILGCRAAQRQIGTQPNTASPSCKPTSYATTLNCCLARKPVSQGQPVAYTASCRPSAAAACSPTTMSCKPSGGMHICLASSTWGPCRK